MKRINGEDLAVIVACLGIITFVIGVAMLNIYGITTGFTMAMSSLVVAEEL